MVLHHNTPMYKCITVYIMLHQCTHYITVEKSSSICNLWINHPMLLSTIIFHFDEHMYTQRFARASMRSVYRDLFHPLQDFSCSYNIFKHYFVLCDLHGVHIEAIIYATETANWTRFNLNGTCTINTKVVQTYSALHIACKDVETWIFCASNCLIMIIKCSEPSQNGWICVL